VKRREFLSGIIAGAALAEMACSRSAPQTKLRKLKIAASRRLTTSSLHLAYELGYFKEAGFDIEILQAGNAGTSMALLAGGKVDAYLGGASTALLNAIIKGLRLKIVAGREVASTSCGNIGAVYGLRRTFPRGLDDLGQLRGKRVATGPAIGLAHFSLDSHLAHAGLTRQDIHTVSLDFRESVPALLGGGVDAIIGTDDFDKELASLSSNLVHSAGLASIHPDFQYSFILFGETLATEDPRTGGRFLGAYLRGARAFAAGGTPKFMQEFAKANHFDLSISSTLCRSTFPPDGAISLDSLRLFSDWALEKKHIPRRVETSELADDRYLKTLNAA
jgi:NitT/TauT family transport system substrate-binding protein